MCASWKRQVVGGTMGILCQSACEFLLPPRTHFHLHSCGHKATSDRQIDRQTNKQNKDRQAEMATVTRCTGRGWFWPCLTSLSYFWTVRPCLLIWLSELHTLTCQKLKPWLKKDLLTKKKNMSGSSRATQKGSMSLCVCMLNLPGNVHTSARV